MFLPILPEECKTPDFVIVTGDAYVDHPSFAHAVIGRVLQNEGFSVAVIAQPNYKNTDDFKRFGRPRLGFLVSAGNIDSMVAHYTVNKKLRTDDAYSPGGKFGLRPDLPTIVYSNRIREAYGSIAIIVGGIEASLRRFAHYDYKTDKVRRSILVDSGANLLVYGMGEKQITEIAHRLNSGEDIKGITNVRGTTYVSDNEQICNSSTIICCPSFEDVSESKQAFANAFKLQYDEQDPIRGRTLVQPCQNKVVVQNPPAVPLTQKELDRVYSLPYERTYHPIYEEQGGVPAIREVEFSIVSSRGCFGGCSFCSLTFHQGRMVSSRSHKSILSEAERLTHYPNFKGYIHDVGGPTANFRKPSCAKQEEKGLCKDRQCLYPSRCPNLDVSHADYISLLRKLRSIPGIKKIFIRSGIRFDYLIYDRDDTFFNELYEHHISGQLKVAPEHVSNKVLYYMGKPPHLVYDKFVRKFNAYNERLISNNAPEIDIKRKPQYIVPYFISSHPGSTLSDAVELAEYLRDIKYNPEQVQDFYPTPGTISTCMYYTGIDPRTMKNVYVPRDYAEKQMQRALLQYRNPKNYDLVYKALIKAGRADLIGFDKKCLIRPAKNNYRKVENNGKNNKRKASIGKNTKRTKGKNRRFR